MTRFSILLITMAVSVIFSTGACGQNRFKAYRDDYSKIWLLVKRAYYDQTYNNQDWNNWRYKFDGLIFTPDDSHKAIETMLWSLGDPYTKFVRADEYRSEQTKLVGVGMQLGMNKEHQVVVIAPMNATPAYRAGVKPGWEIYAVDGKSIKGESLDSVVRKIRGEPDTKVTLSFRTGSRENKKDIEIRREAIPIKSIALTTVLPGNIGYIRLDSLEGKVVDEIRTALKKVAKTNGLILDLRNNPGGEYTGRGFTESIRISKLLLNRGTIVSTIDSDGYKTSTFADNSAVYTRPMVLLINKGTARFCELIAGALQDNGRARIVGEKSFGCALVSADYPLDDGSHVFITIARMLTPKDRDFHRSGIKPDVQIKLENADWEEGRGPWWIDLTYKKLDRNPEDGGDIQLNKALEVLRN